MDEDSKSLKPLFFNGEKAKFTEWQARFTSYAFYKGFDEILEGTSVLIQNETEDEALTEDQIKFNTTFRKNNSYAYATLMQVVKDTVGFNAINNAKNDAFPKGDAYQAWVNL